MSFCVKLFVFMVCLEGMKVEEKKRDGREITNFSFLPLFGST